MSTFNFKTATPDVTFPSGGFLFGADSQSAATPSIYAGTTYLAYILGLANTWTATQTITPAANTSALAVTGYSLTGSNAQSLIDLAGTWNTSGTPTALKLNVTDTASNTASLLMDLQVGGSTIGAIRKNPSDTVPLFTGQSGKTSGISIWDSIRVSLISNSVEHMQVINGNVTIASHVKLGFSPNPSGAIDPDTVLVRDAANTLALRNSTNAQTQRWYGTYTDGSNYRRIAISMTTAGVASIAPEGAGTGASGNVLHISGLPTSNPGAGILWNNAGTVEVGT